MHAKLLLSMLLTAELLQRVWGTELLCDVSLFASMVLVALPDGLAGGAASSSLTYENAEQIQDTLYHQFKIEVYDMQSPTA